MEFSSKEKPTSTATYAVVTRIGRSVSRLSCQYHHVDELSQVQVCLVRVTSSSKSSPMLNREFNLQVCNGHGKENTHGEYCHVKKTVAATKSVELRPNNSMGSRGCLG